MVVFRKKRTTRRILYSWITLFILTIISGFLLYGVIDVIKKNKETRKNKQVALGQMATLKEREAELGSLIEALKTDQGIEESIREKFSLVKEGEEFIIIIDDPKEEDAEDNKKNKGNFFQFFKNLFK